MAELFASSLIVFAASLSLKGESVKIQPFLSHVGMHKIRAILFDLDNTLVDFIHMKQASCKAAAQAMVASGLRMPETEAYERLIKTYFSVGIESDNAFSEFLKKRTNLTIRYWRQVLTLIWMQRTSV